MLHELKLNEKYCDSVYWGVKLFEIRRNDRDYKVGDFVHFTAVSDDGMLFTVVNAYGTHMEHPISRCYYQITYILSDFCGLAENYIAFGIQPHKCFYSCCKRFAECGIDGCFGCIGSEIERQQGI